MPEEEAFCVMVSLMTKYQLRDLYKPSMTDLSLCFYQLEKLIEVREKWTALWERDGGEGGAVGV